MPDPIKERLEKKFKEIPKWAEDFPLDNQKDVNISRRDFIRYLGLVSAGFFIGTAGIWLKSLWGTSPRVSWGRIKIIDKEDLKVGESYVFQIPGIKQPAILVRLSPEKFVAYGQKCTHLQCPVIWKKDENVLFCPCHKGAFKVESGDVLAGPPERPLPKLRIEVSGQEVYFAGMERGELV